MSKDSPSSINHENMSFWGHFWVILEPNWGYHKMMEWMRLAFVHCAPTSTPPHFVVNVMKITVGVLIYVLKKWKSQLWSHAVCSMGKGFVLIPVCLGGIAWVS